MSITYKRLICEFKKGTTLLELAEREGISEEELKVQIHKAIANKKSVKDIIAKLESNEKNKEKKSRRKALEVLQEEIHEETLEEGKNENSERIQALNSEVSARVKRITDLETLLEKDSNELKEIKDTLAIDYITMKAIFEQFNALMQKVNPLIEQYNSVKSEAEKKKAELDVERAAVAELQKKLQELTAINLTEEEMKNNSLERSEVNEAIHLLFDFVDEKTTISDIRKIATWMLVIDKISSNTGRTVTAIFEEKSVVSETLISLGYSVTYN